MDRHDALFFEKAVQPGNGTGLAALCEFNPENNKTSMGISATHIGDKLDLSRGMLVRMVMGPAREIVQGLNGAVMMTFSAIDILSVGFVFNGSFGDTILYFSLAIKYNTEHVVLSFQL